MAKVTVEQVMMTVAQRTFKGGCLETYNDAIIDLTDEQAAANISFADLNSLQTRINNASVMPEKQLTKEQDILGHLFQLWNDIHNGRLFTTVAEVETHSSSIGPLSGSQFSTIISFSVIEVQMSKTSDYQTEYKTEYLGDAISDFYKVVNDPIYEANYGIIPIVFPFSVVDPNYFIHTPDKNPVTDKYMELKNLVLSYVDVPEGDPSDKGDGLIEKTIKELFHAMVFSYHAMGKTYLL